MKRFLTVLAQMLAGVLLVASAAAETAVERTPAVRRTKDALHAHVQARIEVNRQKLPEEFQRRKNFAWAVAKVEGLNKQEYFAHSGIQNLDDLSDEAAAQIQGISAAPSNAVFETFCVNRKNVVNGPDCWDRRVDTEFKILEDIAAQLDTRTNASGRIRLYTDLYPCKSCLHVMEQFMTKYPNIGLEVLYKD